jgi:hypothetical protein
MLRLVLSGPRTPILFRSAATMLRLLAQWLLEPHLRHRVRRMAYSVLQVEASTLAETRPSRLANRRTVLDLLRRRSISTLALRQPSRFPIPQLRSRPLLRLLRLFSLSRLKPPPRLLPCSLLRALPLAHLNQQLQVSFKQALHLSFLPSRLPSHRDLDFSTLVPQALPPPRRQQLLLQP